MSEINLGIIGGGQLGSMLAVAAKKSFDNYSPGGMKVHGGAVILEPGLTQKHFNDAAEKGVWLAKAGFGQFKSAFEYKPFVKMAQKAGMIVNVHTGGASIPDSSPRVYSLRARTACTQLFCPCEGHEESHPAPQAHEPSTRRERISPLRHRTGV